MSTNATKMGSETGQNRKRYRQKTLSESLSSDDENGEDSAKNWSDNSGSAPKPPNKKTRKLAGTSVATTTGGSYAARYASGGNNGHNTTTVASKSKDCGSNSEASKKILDKFLKANANADSVKRALELHRMAMESEGDDSSTGSDFGRVWGISSKNTDANSNRSVSMESSDDDDSSIELVAASPRGVLLTPGGGGPNGRHLSGRQRRLEAARSKNRGVPLFSENNEGHDDDSSIDDNIGVDICDDGMDVDVAAREGTDKRHEDGVENPGNGAGNGADNGVSSGDQEKGPASEPTEPKPTHTVEKVSKQECVTTATEPNNDGSVESSGQKPVSGGIESTPDTNGRNTSGVVRTTANGAPAPDESKLPQANAIAKQTNNESSNTAAKNPSVPTTGRSSEPTIGSGVFDNLFCNGKDFLDYVGITDPDDFLHRCKELGPLVNAWRSERKLPLFTNTAGYLQNLRNQIRDNKKKIAARRKKRNTQKNNGSPSSRSRQSRANKLAKINLSEVVYPDRKDIPMHGGAFMDYMGITDFEDFLTRKNLNLHLNAFREQRNLTTCKHTSCYVSRMRSWIRNHTVYPQGMDNALGNNVIAPEEIDFSNCMKLVGSLSKRFLNSKTGLPVYQFAVHDTLSQGKLSCSYAERVEMSAVS